MRSSTFLVIASALLAGPAGAIEVVADGLSVERIRTLDDGAARHLEVVRNSAYGEGVLAGVVEKGSVRITRFADSEPSLLAVLGPFNETAHIVTMRFDTTGQFGNRLLVSVVHDGALGGENVVSDLYAVGPDGSAKRLKSFGSAQNPVMLNFEISDGSRGYEAGLYLQDRNRVAGSPLYHMDASLELSVLGEDFLPRGRSDLDVRGMRFDPTGLYSSQLYLADADDHDRLSGVYLLDSRLRWTEVVRPEPLASVDYGELAFSSGGPLEQSLYVIERVGNRVVRVSPTGGRSDFATGFRGIASISISDDGTTMYVSDEEAIYRIRAAPRQGG